MDTLTSTVQVIHIVTAMLMAWPFYALVAVNQRVRLGPPLSDRVSVQPRIDALFAQAGGGAVSQEVAQQIGTLRLRRKRMASVCMFVVLTVAMLGVQVWNPFSIWLTMAFVMAIGVFAWRAYTSVTPYGWL
jgi:hypothetical protein